ncbi:hypothetical protein DPMN_110573 [Dreissena polymorpha]|uniref:Uncharacterized protein n=1 Tax=Dreissena polymorpha TaxID=45954 RepID=A0A9D4QN61_DREPO|nr:hypothetical protein DPMN_110573 [Dreissena polymorpha]
MVQISCAPKSDENNAVLRSTTEANLAFARSEYSAGPNTYHKLYRRWNDDEVGGTIWARMRLFRSFGPTVLKLLSLNDLFLLKGTLKQPIDDADDLRLRLEIGVDRSSVK